MVRLVRALYARMWRACMRARRTCARMGARIRVPVCVSAHVQAPLPTASMYLVTKSLASHASVPHASQSHHVYTQRTEKRGLQVITTTLSLTQHTLHAAYVCRLDGAHLVEPFMETTFATVWDDEGNAPASTLSASSFDWAIVRRPEEQGEFELDLASSGAATTTISGTGSVFVHTFNELGYHHLELSQEGAGVTTHGLWVRYVRREIRSVDDDDREALLAAFHVLINTTDDAGIALYGSNFKSYQRLSTEHNNFGEFRSDLLLYRTLPVSPQRA